MGVVFWIHLMKLLSFFELLENMCYFLNTFLDSPLFMEGDNTHFFNPFYRWLHRPGYMDRHEPRLFWHDTIVSGVGPARGMSCTVFGLGYKPIGRHGHDSFIVSPFSLMLSTNSPSNWAPPVCGSTVLILIWPTIYIYKYDQINPHFQTTSRLPVRCDGLQQYPRKLSIKKSRFFIDCLRSLYNIFLIWLTDVIVYSMQYVLVQHD
jgi:hypothetical protein